MRFSAAAAAALSASGVVLLCSEVSAFSVSRHAFVSRTAAVQSTAAAHQPFCPCGPCALSGTRLFADTTAETEEAAAETPTEASAEIPAEVEAMDGIASADEAHNAERPAREAIKKKRTPKGKPLSDFSEGDSVKGKVKTITSYGAFMDIGAQTDAMVHISRVASGFVKDVNEVLKIGEEVDARIISIDSGKNQIALSLMTEEEEADAAQSRPKRQERRGGPQRRDDSAVLNALQEKGWETDKFVEGEVVSTVDFGAFVRVDASKLNAEVEGEMDGLVHISSLSVGRADSVTAFANVGDKVQVRCKGIQGGKISLSMIAEADEQKPRGSRQPIVEGAKDWKEQLEKARSTMPEFNNGPLVVDMRD